MAQPPFVLEPRLAAGAFDVCRLDLCHVLLKDDARWPWLILVPERRGLRELHDLTETDAAQLSREVRAASRAVAALPEVQKVNVGALGNVVRQLHVHVVGRAEGDGAWPDPVWGVKGREPYSAGAADALIVRLKPGLLAGH
jgi:diadenosine tetraphosphate (Ap4A) HIT family hydrolase